MEELMTWYVARHIGSFCSNPQFVHLMSQGGDLVVDVLHGLTGITLEPRWSVEKTCRTPRNGADRQYTASA